MTIIYHTLFIEVTAPYNQTSGSPSTSEFITLTYASPGGKYLCNHFKNDRNII